MFKPVLNGEVVAASTSGAYHYLYGKLNTEVAFFKLETDFTSNANRCYLETDTDIQPQSQDAKGLTLNFVDNDVTSIHATPRNAAAKAVYTIMGQRVESMSTPGIYIVDGKKIVVK